MKKITRMLFFSTTAIYLTDLWNHGFSVILDWKNYLTAVFVVGVLYYFINPILKLILLPINILSLGLVSIIVYFFLFHFLLNYFSVISIEAWTFNNVDINYWLNVCLSALSVSLIINCLEWIL